MSVNKTTAIWVLFLLTYSVSASAGLTGQGVLDQVITEFSTRSSAWAIVISTRASRLFWGLTAFSMVWTFAPMIAKQDFSEFWLEAIRYSVFIGFFAFLLEGGPTIAMSIMDSLRMIGAEASGTGKDLSPSDIVDIGFMIWNQAIENFSSLNVVDSIVGAALSIVILVILALIATNLLLLIVSSWVLSYAGAFLLGFGSTRWTNDMAISYFKTVLGVGMQMLTMVLLIGIGKDLLVSFYDKMSKGSLNAEELGVMMIVSIVLFNLTNKIPPMIGGIASGGGLGAGGGIGNFGAGAAMGAAMTAASMGGAALSAAGGTAMSGAANTAGIADAFSAASENSGIGGNSMDSGSSMMSTAGSGPKEDGGAALAAAMGDNDTGGGQSSSGSQGGSMSSRLASGIKDAAKSKAGEIKQNFTDKVSQTAGGKVASAIRAADAAYNSGVPDSDDNSLSAGTESEQPSPMDQSEADAFVNKNS
ncbi:MAG: P-type conjugative transfer protein TrbL [Sulfuricurvum sp.]|nr:P-type conjugative transfer protein TrbL [Sulfuricurvum sp.]